MSDYESRKQSSRKRSEAADRERVRKVQQAAHSGTSRGRGDSTGRTSAGRSTSSHRSTSTGRSSYSSAGRSSYNTRNRRRRRRGVDVTRVIITVGALLIVVLLVVLGVRSCGKGSSTSVAGTTAAKQESTATEPETEMERNVTVQGISINGLTHSEAKKAILESFDWSMKLTYQDQEIPLNNLLEAPLDALLTSVYEGDKSTDTYTLEEPDIAAAAAEAAKAAAAEWNVKAQNAGIGEFNPSTSRFSFVGGKNGVSVEEEKLAKAIQDAVNAGNYQASIAVSTVETAPAVSIEQAKDMYTTIGTYTTKTTSNKDRNTNVSLAAAAINGKVLAPGETFSMNSATGERTYEKGYRPAGAYVNGELVLEPGGGVCQVSSTLYNAVVFAGLKTTERYAHSYEPSYVTPGEDAMISFPGLDMKFVNNTDYAIGLKASFSNQTLTISIVGVSSLEEGVKVSMLSEKVNDLEPPAPKYVEDTTLQPGQEVVVTQPKMGSKWVTYLVKTKNGKEVSKEVFHNSTYKGKPATIKRNTSGKVTETNKATEATETETAGVQDGTLDTVLPGAEGSTGVNTDHNGPADPSGGNAGSTKPQPTETVKETKPESKPQPTESVKETKPHPTEEAKTPGEQPPAKQPDKPSEPSAEKPSEEKPAAPGSNPSREPIQQIPGNSSANEPIHVIPKGDGGADAPIVPGGPGAN